MSLTPNQRKFAELFVASGGQNAADCARKAGYTPARAKIEASELLRHPGILEEIRRLVQSRLSASIAFASAELEHIARDRNSKDRAVQLKAVSALLDRGGLLLSRLDELHVFHHRPSEELPAGQRLLQAILPALEDMGLSITNQGRFDAYMRSLDAIDHVPAPVPMIDVTPQITTLEEWTAA
jgi:hypothetical protein